MGLTKTQQTIWGKARAYGSGIRALYPETFRKKGLAMLQAAKDE